MGIGIRIGVYKPVLFGLQFFLRCFTRCYIILVSAVSLSKLRYVGMTAENTNILEGTLQRSLVLEDFSFYRTDLILFSLAYQYHIFNLRQRCYPMKTQKMGDTNFSVEVLLIFV